MGDKSSDREDKMSVAYINDLKGMADFLLEREFKGPGDTIEAAAHRAQTKYGAPASLILRLRNRVVNDMMMSSAMAIATAYLKAQERVEKAYAHEKSMAVNPAILRLANFVAGAEGEA